MASSSLAAHLLLFLSLSLATISIADDGPSVQDTLLAHGLPKGLLPDAVASYSLSDTGDFVVKLKSPCYVQFTDLAYYGNIIKGKLSYGRITRISGIQARKYFIWLDVTGLVLSKDGTSIQFQTGYFSESFPVSMFSEVPDCLKDDVGRPCNGRKHGGESVMVSAAAAS